MAIRALFFSLVLIAAAFSEEAPLLVGNDPLTPADTAAGPQFTEAVTFERNEFASSAHEYLGWAAVTMGLATGLSAGALAGEPSHEAMGYSAAGLAAAAGRGHSLDSPSLVPKSAQVLLEPCESGL